MAGRRDPTNELMAYLETRLEADGLDYREAVMIEDLMASLCKLQGSANEEAVDPSPADTTAPACNDTGFQVLGPKRRDPERF